MSKKTKEAIKNAGRNVLAIIGASTVIAAATATGLFLYLEKLDREYNPG